MKVIDVALKDLKRVFRSVFSLIMMFGAPLLIAGLLYFAFGSLTSGNSSFSLPRTRVVVVNMDQPDSAPNGFKAGELLVSFLQEPDLAPMLELSSMLDEASALAAVDNQEADVALIIPANFSRAAGAPGQKASVKLYQDPTLSIGPGIVRDLVNHYMDGFSGASITAGIALSSSPTTTGAVLSQEVMRQYAAFLQNSDHAAALQVVSPVGNETKPNSGIPIIGPIMAAMLILFVFFMGSNGAQSIIREQEEATLARLFTAPISRASILGGKFLGVFITLVLQAIVLLAASALIFHISWGQPLAVALSTFALIVAATGFGVMLMSFIKETRQTGPILGGVMTLTGMVGGLFTNGIPNIPPIMSQVALSMPQGWAMQAFKLCLMGSSANGVLFSAFILTVLGAGFFLVGLMLFRRRFA